MAQRATPPFKLKKLLYATTAGVIGAGCIVSNASAATFYTADTSNSTTSTVGLNQSNLGNAVLGNPSALTTGSNVFKYSAIIFTPTSSGSFTFGQTYAPSDTVMILYNGVYDPSSPGTGAIVGNDDTAQGTHRTTLGDPTLNVSCGSSSWCPQITFSVTAGITYTLFVSGYSISASNNLTLPFQFYSTGDVVFGGYTGRSPIDLMQPNYLGSELGVTVDPIFVGGTLKMDQVNGIYTDDFTLSNIATSTIDQNGNNSVFTGILSDAISGTPGVITIDNTGAGGSVRFEGINTYTGSTTLKGGTLVVSQDANLGDPTASLIFDGGALQTVASFSSARDVTLNSTGTVIVDAGTTFDLSGVVSGTGSWSKNGAGTLVLNADNIYTGITTIDAGTLMVGDSSHPTAALSGGGSVIVNAGGTLGGYGSITADVNNSGIVAPGSAANVLSGTTGNLTIHGNYIGNNGALHLNGALGDDVSSVTDKLVIDGNASGTTYVTVSNVGGLGGQTLEGFEIIDVSGTSTGSAFVQGGRIVAGAYEYSLMKGNVSGLDPESWYLTSQYIITDQGGNKTQTGVYMMRPEGGTYSANLAAANNMFNMRLHDRLGEPQFADSMSAQDKVSSLWIRYDYGHNRSEDSSGQLTNKSDRSVVQVGGDIAQWSSNGSDRFHLGVMGGYGRVNIDTDSSLTGYRSSGKVDGYSLGVYGTWYANQEDKSGLYVDGWILWNDVNAKVNGSGLAEESYDIKGVTASLEAGYSFQIGQMNEEYGVWIQPQAQVTWMGAKADDHMEHNGTWVTSNRNNVQTRLGARGYLSNINSQASQNVVQPYLELNWIHNTKSYHVNMGGTEVSQDGAKDVGEVRIGMEANISRNTTLWFNVGHQVGSNSYRDTAAQFGLKYSF